MKVHAVEETQRSLERNEQGVRPSQQLIGTAANPGELRTGMRLSGGSGGPGRDRGLRSTQGTQNNRPALTILSSTLPPAALSSSRPWWCARRFASRGPTGPPKSTAATLCQESLDSRRAPCRPLAHPSGSTAAPATLRPLLTSVLAGSAHAQDCATRRARALKIPNAHDRARS